MQKIEMTNGQNQNFLEIFEMFFTSQAAKGVADITLRNTVRTSACPMTNTTITQTQAQIVRLQIHADCNFYLDSVCNKY